MQARLRAIAQRGGAQAAGAQPTAGAAAPAGPQGVVFFHGDRVPPPTNQLAARLQRPGEIAALLASKFPGCSASVVMPRYEGDFACFDGWLPLAAPGRQGVPRAFDPTGFPAARSLWSVVRQQAAAATEAAPGGRLVLLGFSKGAVVLHQVLAELAEWQRQSGQRCAVCVWQAHQPCMEDSGAGETAAAAAAAAATVGPAAAGAAAHPAPWEAALAGVRELHWLDAGANSSGAAYPAGLPLFQALACRCEAHAVRLHLHGTPRQWHDPSRRWLGQEAAAMVAAVRAAGVACSLREYFAGQPPSLEQHYAILEAFEP